MQLCSDGNTYLCINQLHMKINIQIGHIAIKYYLKYVQSVDCKCGHNAINNSNPIDV